MGARFSTLPRNDDGTPSFGFSSVVVFAPKRGLSPRTGTTPPDRVSMGCSSVGAGRCPAVIGRPNTRRRPYTRYCVCVCNARYYRAVGASVRAAAPRANKRVQGEQTGKFPKAGHHCPGGGGGFARSGPIPWRSRTDTGRVVAVVKPSAPETDDLTKFRLSKHGLPP